MAKLSPLLLACLALTSCAGGESRLQSNGMSTSATSTPVPTRPSPILLKPVKPDPALSRKQKLYLDQSIPLDVRSILENAESFEILAEVDRDERSESDILTFEPNRIAQIPTDEMKKQVLEAFYSDAANEDSPANCYEPHHSMRATYQGKMVEIEICFACAQFFVKTDLAKNLQGTIVRDGRKSEELFLRIVNEIGAEWQR